MIHRSCGGWLVSTLLSVLAQLKWDSLSSLLNINGYQHCRLLQCWPSLQNYTSTHLIPDVAYFLLNGDINLPTNQHWCVNVDRVSTVAYKIWPLWAEVVGYQSTQISISCFSMATQENNFGHRPSSLLSPTLVMKCTHVTMLQIESVFWKLTDQMTFTELLSYSWFSLEEQCSSV